MTRFSEIDWDKPLHIDEYRALVPLNGTVRGTQFAALASACAEIGNPFDASYNALKSYPGDAFLTVLVEAAQRLHQKVSLREGLRRLGYRAYPALKETLVGKIIFAAAGRDIGQTWKLATRGYQASSNTGGVELLESDSTHVIVRLTDIYSFIDAWHVGILEGVASIHGFKAHVTMHRLSPMSADFFVEMT